MFPLSWAVVAGSIIPSVLAGVSPWQSPEYKYIFQYPLPIPPIKAPSTSWTSDDGKTIDFYEIDIKQFEAQTYPNLGTTTYVGYDGMAPGPTFHMTRGREAVVRFINQYDRPSSIHLHGSYSRTPFDGWAEDRTYPGQYKDYYYPNAQPMRTLWYHDHSLSITAVNAYMGQAGFYILKDPNPPNPAVLDLPSDDYDIPLMLAAKQFQSNGKLVSPENERVSLYGDVITVNAQPWPYFNVEARKYKFRLLDGSISRTFKLYLVADDAPNTRLQFTVVGADAGYMSKPVPSTYIIIAMAERYEIVIDFDKYEGKNLTLMNERDFQTNPDFPATDRVIRFVVGKKTSDVGNGNIPNPLATLAIPEEHTTLDHSFTFERQNGQWLINGVGFEDIKNRVVAFPKQGKVERWELINNSGGWSHPIHIHLIDFQVVKRSGGRGVVEPFEAAALKDVVYLGMNERIELVANYAPWSGVYMFHCHNLVHEDHDMMAAFNVSQIDLTEFGYPQTTSFVDPMTKEFQAKNCADYPGSCPSNGNPIDLSIVRSKILPGFYSTNAYPDAAKFEKAEDDFYIAHPDGVVPTSTNGGRNGGTSTSAPTTLKTSTTASASTSAKASTTAKTSTTAKASSSAKP